MRDHGFIAKFAFRPQNHVREISLNVPAEWRTCEDRNFKISAKPFATTPETVSEIQPIETELLLTAYMGRCDNRDEVAQALSDFSLAYAPDGRIFTAAYEAWGTRFPAHLHGEFCFALFDRTKGKLVAGRSPIAAPNLYYMQCEDNSVIVSSDLNLLLSSLDFSPAIDEAFIAEYWADRSLMYTERTPYQSISRLMPNRILTADGTGVCTSSYFKLDPDRIVEYGSNQEYEDHLRHLLFEAVRRSLRCTGHIFADLSGGLDSSTIVCIAAELQKRGHVFEHGLSTISYTYSSSPTCEETVYWKPFTEQLPFKSYAYDLDERPPFTGWPSIVFAEPDPQICVPAFEYLLGEWMPAKGGRVVIKGIAGDEVLSGLYGYPIHLSDYLRRFDFFGWLRETNDWYRNRREFNLFELIWKYGFQALISPDRLLGKDDPSTPTWMNADYARTQVEPRYHRDRAKVPPGIPSIATRYHYEMLLHLESYQLHEAARVEDRLPLVYRPLVEFMLAVPWAQKINSTYDRWLQRRAFVGLLPENIRTRRRKAGNEESTLRGIRLGWNWIEELLSGLRIAKRGYVEHDSFRTALLQLRHGLVADQLPFLLGALRLEVWLRTHETV